MTELDEDVETSVVEVAAARPAPAKRRAPRSETRIADEPAFVLHAYPYKETSLVIDVLTRHHGRVGLVARGAKRPRSALRGVLLAFRPLMIQWIQGKGRSGGGELGTLTKAEWMGGLPALGGEGLMSGFYLNELLQKLLARDDPHEALFDAYVHALTALTNDYAPAPILRRFEVVLLREAGYALRLDQTASGEAIDPDAHYRYLAEQGPVRIEPRVLNDRVVDHDAPLSGRTLLAMEADDYTSPDTLAEAKLLMRNLLQHHLSGQMLQTRRLVLDLQLLEDGASR